MPLVDARSALTAFSNCSSGNDPPGKVMFHLLDFGV
jgi:hypothetical protein